jgi:hypothetical protein
LTNNETQKLTGRRMRIETGADGVYVGELLELEGSLQWRGRVRITGVLSPARHYEHSAVCRRGFRPGEFLDTTQGTVSETDEAGYSTYMDAVSAQLNRFVGSHSGYPTSQYPWVGEVFGQALGAVMQAESRRLATGQWNLLVDEASGQRPFGARG